MLIEAHKNALLAFGGTWRDGVLVLLGEIRDLGHELRPASDLNLMDFHSL